jgi:hypothetical protein
MQQPLITTNDVKTNSRDVSQYVSDDKIQIYIEESENIDIKSALGDALFLDVKEHPENYSDLLNGAVYDTRRGERKSFTGLKKALCYYSFARLMKNGDFNVNRFGTVNKTSEYSSNAEYKEKVTAYNDAFDVANRYLKECVVYLNEKKDLYPLYKGKGGIKANRTVFRILGE